MSSPAVSIIVPNWNGRAHIEPLLDALAAQTHRDFETVVVDNGSSDGSAQLLSERDDVRLIALDRNTGFTGAVNRGVAASTSDLVLLLNADMEPRPTFVAELVAAATAYRDAGSFACKVLRQDDPRYIDSAGDRLARSGRSTGIGRDDLDGRGFDAARWVFGGTGGAVLYRRAALEAVGGFDDDFFLYVEDTDVAFRAQMIGWRCRFVPAAVTLHVGSASMRGREDVRARYCLRNYLYFLLKDYPWPWLVRYRRDVMRQLVREVGFAFRATRAHHGGVRAVVAIVRTLLLVLWRAPTMLHKRSRLARRVDLAELERAVFE